MKRLVAAFLALLVASPAWAGTGTLAYTPSGSSNLRFTTDAGSNYLNNITIWDYSAGVNGLGIDANHGAAVAGEAASGSAVLGNPVLVGGSDGTNARSLTTNSSGDVVVVGTGTFAVQATLQASATTAIGKVDPNTIASWGLGATGSAVVTNTLQVGGSDGTDLRTLTTDTGGHLIVEPGNTANTTAWLVNVGRMGGTAINSGCVSSYGTAPSAVACPSANVFVTNATTNVSNASSGVATGSGNSPTVAYGYAFNGTTWDQLQDDAAKNLKVASIGQANVTATDCSGTVTIGGTAQNAFTAQTALHGFTVANIDTTEPLWISFTTTAAASGTGSYPLAAATATTFANLSSFTAPPGFGLNHALSVIAATTSHKFSCTWW